MDTSDPSNTPPVRARDPGPALPLDPALAQQFPLTPKEKKRLRRDASLAEGFYPSIGGLTVSLVSGAAGRTTQIFSSVVDRLALYIWRGLDGGDALWAAGGITAKILAQRELQPYFLAAPLALLEYAYRGLTNALLNELRAGKNLEPASDELMAAFADSGQIDTLEALVREELKVRINREVRALPEEFREPILLRYALGLTYEEITEKLRIPRSTAQFRVTKGLEMMREPILTYLQGGL